MASALDYSRFVTVLRAGGVVACATETGIALMADATNATAVSRVFEVKGREAAQVSALLAPSADHAKRVLDLSHPELARLVQEHWPGPLTVVAPATAAFPEGIVKDGSVGIRVPGPSPAFELVHAFGALVTATSANRTGCAPSHLWREVERELDVDAVVPANAPGGEPSTLVRVDDSGSLKVIRAGAVPVATS